MVETKLQKGQIWPALFPLIFTLLVTGMVIAGYTSYQNYKQQFRIQVERQLMAIADLKVGELEQWRAEHFGDARILQGNPDFSDLAARFLQNPQSAEAEQRLRNWLALYQAYGQYDVIRLHDLQGKTLLTVSLTGETPISLPVIDRIPEAIKSNKPIMVDFYRNEPDGPAYLTLLVPIVSEGQPLGVLSMRINPRTYLYPFIQRWPVPSQTAETLLVRRDGNSVLFLNELKFKPDAALNLRISLESTKTLAVKAVLGQTGIAEGIDYRNVPVIGTLCPVPNSPWFLVSRIDTTEVYAPLRERLQQTIFFFGVLIIGVGAGLAAFYRQQQLHFYRQQYQVMEALKQSEARLRGYIDNAPTGVFITDETGAYLEVNPVACKITGYSAEELLRMRISDLLPSEAQALGAEHFQRAVETGQASGELAFRHKDGRVRYWLVDAVKLSSTRFMGFAADVTERRQMEEQLRTINNRLILTQQISHTGSWEYNVETTEIWGSDEAVTIYGLQPSDGFPIDQIEACIPERERVHQALIDLLEQEKVCELEFAINPADGTKQKIISSFAKLIKDENGKPVKVAGVLQDITRRKQAETALQQSERKLETMLQTMVDGMATVDTTGRIVYSNRSAEQILGIGKDILNRYYYGREWNSLDEQGNPFPPDQLPLAIALREQRSVADVQHQIVDSDGVAKWLSVNAAPLFDDTGQLIGAIASFRDITGVKRTEQALKERAAELERFNSLMVDRELRMVELKKEINRLCAAQGLPPRYNLTFIDDEKISD